MMLCFMAAVNRADGLSVVGEAESRSRGGEDVPGSHRGVCPEQGGQPAGPGRGGSPRQVKQSPSLLATFSPHVSSSSPVVAPGLNGFLLLFPDAP